MHGLKRNVNKNDYFDASSILDVVIAIVDIIAEIIFVGWKMQKNGC
jgi:hypothetical protein